METRDDHVRAMSLQRGGKSLWLHCFESLLDYLVEVECYLATNGLAKGFGPHCEPTSKPSGSRLHSHPKLGQP